MAKRWLVASWAAICCVTVVLGQSSAPPPSPKPGSSAEEPAASSLGFAIETEMFTYKALTENSKVLACDVARYLYNSEVDAADEAAATPCKIRTGTQSSPGIVIISPGSSLLADFQLWRADMAIMGDLEMRAAKVCSPSPALMEESRGIPEKGAASAASGLLDLTPAGQAFSVFQGALGMLARNQSVTAVAGTVRDQALMNEIARQLRSLNIQVLIPEIYTPYALGVADYKNSPYLRRLEGLFDARESCETAKAGPAAPGQAAQIDNVINSIESFLKMATPSVEPPPEPSPKSSLTGTNNNSGTPEPSQPAPRTASHFAAVFAADGVARLMGFSAETGTGSNATWQHILWVKALESGGSVTRQSNLFGTKIRFSGGAVDTYAVFQLDGILVCSGNVYNFESPVRISDLEQSFRAQGIGDPTKSPEVSSTCSMIPHPSM